MIQGTLFRLVSVPEGGEVSLVLGIWMMGTLFEMFESEDMLGG